MTLQNIGILHPGQMGASVGAACRAGVETVLWTAEGRGAATCERAEKAGLADAGTLAALAGRADLVISVCPPHAAVEVARDVARLGFDGVYLDANAISPDLTRQIGQTVESGGATFVDGGIVGPPAWQPGKARLYLSGTEAPRVAECFAGSPLEAIVIDAPVGAASALKMVYAAYTKGTTALLSAILAVAQHEGVRSVLEREWRLSQPALAESVEGRVRSNTAKAWRFEGEMDQIAATFAGAGLPEGFHKAAGEVYRRLAPLKDADPPPPLDQVLAALLNGNIAAEEDSSKDKRP